MTTKTKIFKIEIDEDATSDEVDIDEDSIESAIEMAYHCQCVSIDVTELTDQISVIFGLGNDDEDESEDEEDEEDDNAEVDEELMNRIMFKITDIHEPDRTVNIDGGFRHHVEVGDVFTYFKYDKNPVIEDGKVLGYLELVGGNLKVTSVDDNYATCQIIRDRTFAHTLPAADGLWFARLKQKNG